MTGRIRLLARMAARNARRQRRRSLLTGLAMALGVAVLVFTRALGDGGHEDWINAGVRIGSGHVAFQHPHFQASRTLADRLSGPAVAAAHRALALPSVAAKVVAVAPRLEVQGLANSASAAVPVLISGVDPEIERTFSQLGDRVVEGRYLEPDDRLHAYIGRRLADRLEIEVGSRLVLTAQDASGEIAGQFVRVVGIFQTGLPEVDEGVVQIPLSTARAWMQVGDGATTIAVLLDSGWDVPGVLRRLRRAVADGPEGLAVVGWREAMPELDAAIKIDDFGGFVFQAILFAIIALAIVNTILMSVMYRTREFGVLRALGLTKAQTAALVFSEGVFLTAVSGVIGMALGFGVTWLFFRNGLDYSFAMKGDLTFSGVLLDPVIVPALRLTQVVLSLGSIFIVGTLASLYPAFRATRIDVAEAMKFEA